MNIPIGKNSSDSNYKANILKTKLRFFAFNITKKYLMSSRRFLINM